ncbi:chemotaxis protein CheW [Iodidimonas sp. SYSU 1G8]|uniref:chemotaxis protein CheW n=1 Tax=Iodidimonas sp. SYSU 1G8 TaxID=3133967 RepID=UPI0031FF0A83
MMAQNHLPEMQDDAVQSILDARTEQLARRGVARDVAATETTPLLVCAIGPEHYGIALDSVVAVVPWRRPSAIPASPSGVLGLIAEKAIVYNAVDLAILLGRPAVDRTGGTLLLLRHQRPRVALLVDNVLHVTHAYEPAMAGERPPAAPDAVTDFLREPEAGQGFGLLDIDTLLIPLLEPSSIAGAT